MDDRNVNKKPYSDQRWRDDPQAVVSLCSVCQRFLLEKSKELRKPVCKKCPDGIPSDLLDLAENDPKPECYELINA